MKKLLIITLLSLIASFSLKAQAEKSLVKSVALNNNSTVVCALKGEVKFSNWDKDYIRITTHIKLDNFNESILKRLVAAGRYELSLKEVAGELWLMMPKAEKWVNINGVDLLESFYFEVTLPEGVSGMITDPSEGL